MASPHIIMLPSDGPISLDKTVDQVLMENPYQPMVIAPLEDPLDKFQHTGPSITLSTQQYDVKQEGQTRQAYIPARFPQTIVTCPEIQKTPHIIMLPLDGAVSLHKTVDQVLIENPDQPIFIAPLEDLLDEFQHTGPSITLSTQQHDVKYEDLTRQAYIPARFPQTMVTCPEKQITHVGKISKRKLTSSERYTPYTKKRNTGSQSCKPLKSLSDNCMKFPQNLSRNVYASRDLQRSPLTSAITLDATRNEKTQPCIPAKSAPSQTLIASAKVQNFHKSGFVGAETSYKRNKPLTEKGESSTVTFKYSKPSLDVSRSISATKNIQKLQSTSAITFKATQESMGQLKAPTKSSTSKLLTSKNKKESKTYTEVSSHSTSPKNLNTELVTPPNVIRNLYSPKEIKDQPITPSFFPDLFNILQPSEQPTSSGMITNSFIPHTTQNQHTSFHSVAKDVNLNSARQGSLASSVGTSSNLIDLTQPENQAPSTSFRDLSSDIRGSPFSCGYSEAPRFQDGDPINHSELWRCLDTLTASLEEDMFGEKDFETIALDDIYEIGSKNFGNDRR
ncbi:uncharacterized protein [Palaemon carinicauda]|uniref:uncharacterized protein n=1 Tax=Palaemon carinicauda TaxID=392227 RepID=UPI0035B6A32C